MADGASKIYTKGGDKGKTSLIGGARVLKSDLRLDVYGTVDELNSVVGVLRAEARAALTGHQAALARLESELATVQRDLFNVGSQLACEDAKIRVGLPTVGGVEIAALEKSMDAFSAQLKPLQHFILPGGTRPAAQAHIARTVCRRAERLCVSLGGYDSGETLAADAPDAAASGANDAPDARVIQYLNRLSDYFFVLARHLNRLQEVDEPIWEGKPAVKEST